MQQDIEYFLDHAIGEGRMEPESRKSSKEEVLSNLGLIKDGIPTNGAVLLFGKYPQRRFVTSSFKIGRFGVDDADLLSQDQIEGNLIQMTDKIMQVLSSKYLIRPIHYEGLQRKEPLEIPEDALREIIFNSIVHKLQFGTWNQMSIYDDHIRLWNEGVLPENYTVETLLSKHTSKPRNPKMAQVFYRAGFIEAWGRGYEKIMKAFDKANLKQPDFTVEQRGVTATIYREIFMSVRGDAKATQDRPETDQKKHDWYNGSEKGSEKSSEKTRDRIVREMKENPLITINELAIMLSISDRAVSKHLKKLQEEGKIRRVGADRGGFWEVLNP